MPNVTSIMMDKSTLVKSTLVSKLSKMNGESPIVMELNQSIVIVHIELILVMDLGLVMMLNPLLMNSYKSTTPTKML